jgi:hypothetical protein
MNGIGVNRPMAVATMVWRISLLLAFLSLGSVSVEQSPGKPNGRTGDKVPLISGGAEQTPSCPALTGIRFYPRKGFAQRMFKGLYSDNYFSGLTTIRIPG